MELTELNERMNFFQKIFVGSDKFFLFCIFFSKNYRYGRYKYSQFKNMWELTRLYIGFSDNSYISIDGCERNGDRIVVYPLLTEKIASLCGKNLLFFLYETPVKVKTEREKDKMVELFDRITQKRVKELIVDGEIDEKKKREFCELFASQVQSLLNKEISYLCMEEYGGNLDCKCKKES